MQAQMPAPLKMAQRYWGMSLVRGIILIIFGLLAIFWAYMVFRLFMLVFGIFAIVEGVLLCLSAFGLHTGHERGTTQAPVQGTDYPRGAGYGQRADTSERTDYSRGAGYSQRAEASAREESTREQTPRGEYVPGTARPEHYAPPRAKAVTASRTTLIVEGVLSIICGILALILPGVIGILALYVIAAWALFKGFGALAQMRTHGWVLGAIGILAIILFLVVLFNPLGIIRALLWVIGIFALIAGIMLVLQSLYHNRTADRERRPIEPSY